MIFRRLMGDTVEAVLGASHEYKFNGDTLDSSGNSRNGTGVNASYVNGKTGAANSAIYFSTGGMQQPVVTQDPSTFSLHFYCRRVSTSDGSAILFGHRSEVTRLIQIQYVVSGLGTVGTWTLQARSSGNSLKQATYVDTPNTSWVSVALVFDKPNSSIALYINKVKQAEITFAFGTQTFTSTLQTLNGYNNGSYTYPSSHEYDQYRFYDGVVLSQEQINNLADEL